MSIGKKYTGKMARVDSVGGKVVSVGDMEDIGNMGGRVDRAGGEEMAIGST